MFKKSDNAADKTPKKEAVAEAPDSALDKDKAAPSAEKAAGPSDEKTKS